jgi:hypothetical protein
MFLSCPFAQACWLKINITFVETDPFLALEEIKAQLSLPFFMDIIILFCWSIWMQRNDLIFKGIQPTPAACFQHFKNEFVLAILKAKVRHKTTMLEWQEALV